MRAHSLRAGSSVAGLALEGQEQEEEEDEEGAGNASMMMTRRAIDDDEALGETSSTCPPRPHHHQSDSAGGVLQRRVNAPVRALHHHLPTTTWHIQLMTDEQGREGVADVWTD